MHDEKTIQWFIKHGKRPPEHIPHGTPDVIQDNIRHLRPHSWRLEGNQLIGKTDMGPLVQTISTDYICMGSDENGLPIFKRISQ